LADPAGDEAGRKELNPKATAVALFVRRLFCAEMVEERSKHPLRLSEKLDDVYKAQKKAKKM
jgi:hypothetical protein